MYVYSDLSDSFCNVLTCTTDSAGLACAPTKDICTCSDEEARSTTCFLQNKISFGFAQIQGRSRFLCLDCFTLPLPLHTTRGSGSFPSPTAFAVAAAVAYRETKLRPKKTQLAEVRTLLALALAREFRCRTMSFRPSDETVTTCDHVRTRSLDVPCGMKTVNAPKGETGLCIKLSTSLPLTHQQPGIISALTCLTQPSFCPAPARRKSLAHSRYTVCRHAFTTFLQSMLCATMLLERSMVPGVERFAAELHISPPAVPCSRLLLEPVALAVLTQCAHGFLRGSRDFALEGSGRRFAANVDHPGLHIIKLLCNNSA